MNERKLSTSPSSGHLISPAGPSFLRGQLRAGASRCRHFLRREEGQSLAELVIVLPLLLVMLAGVFDVGRAIQHYIVLVNAGREAALQGAGVETDVADLDALVRAELERGNLNSAQAEVTVQYQIHGTPPENHVIVDITYPLDMMLSVLSVQTINISNTTRMVTFW